MTGTLWGIGVGPGAPDLLTLRAARLLAGLPVLAWPAPLTGQGMARRIVADHVPPGRDEIAIRLSFAPDRADTEAVYDRAAAAIATRLERGQDVGVLCEGDPMFYGSFLYLLDRMGDRFAVEVVPGISSPMAAAAASLRPLGRLDGTFAVIPATGDDAKLRTALNAADGAAILKVGRHLRRVRALLADLGLDRGAVVVERASHADQRVLPLDQVNEVSYFSLILVQR